MSTPNQTISTNGSGPCNAMSGDPTNPNTYALVMGNKSLQLQYQDVLDSFFAERLVAVRNALREFGWEGRRMAELTKSGFTLSHVCTYVGAGRNVVGIEFQVIGGTVARIAISDTLQNTVADLAAFIDLHAAEEKPSTPDYACPKCGGHTFSLMVEQRIDVDFSRGGDHEVVYGPEGELCWNDASHARCTDCRHCAPLGEMRTTRDVSDVPNPIQEPLTCASVFDGPLEPFDHGHIQTPEHAALFKTGELKIPGHAPEIVGVRFFSFQFNAHQNRSEAIFEIFRNGQSTGTYFASAFKSLTL